MASRPDAWQGRPSGAGASPADGAGEMAEHPAAAGKALGHAAEDEARRGERGVEREADQRHQPALPHRLDADRGGGVDVNDRAEVVRPLPEGPELPVAQREAVDV